MAGKKKKSAASGAKNFPKKTAPCTSESSNDGNRRVEPHEILTSPTIQGAAAAAPWANYAGEPDLSALTLALLDRAREVRAGDLKYVEAMLLSQASVLETIFVSLARRAALNLAEYPDATDRYLRLALKAQGQCRATLETLAQIKNPPIVFARQANVTTGPQQVNNGIPSRTREIDSEQTQLSTPAENPAAPSLLSRATYSIPGSA